MDVPAALRKDAKSLGRKELDVSGNKRKTCVDEIRELKGKAF